MRNILWFVGLLLVSTAVIAQIYTSDLLGSANSATISSMQSAIAGKADASSVPTAASTTPTIVADAGVIGASTAYARADHTHQSNVRKTTVSIAGGAGKATWTFSPAYGSGIVPICIATTITATNATVPYIVNISGTPTNASATIVVFKARATLANLLDSLFGAAENAVQVNVLCTPP